MGKVKVKIYNFSSNDYNSITLYDTKLQNIQELFNNEYNNVIIPKIPLYKEYLHKLGFNISINAYVYIDSFRIIDLWRKNFGLKVSYSPEEPSPADSELAYNLIKEEFNELTLAYLNDNRVEIADALGDLIVVIKQMANVYGMDLNRIVGEITKSNNSKLCTSKEELQQTINRYNEKNIECYYDTIDGNKYIVKRKSDNKVLKSINFKEPDLSFVKLNYDN